MASHTRKTSKTGRNSPAGARKYTKHVKYEGSQPWHDPNRGYFDQPLPEKVLEGAENAGLKVRGNRIIVELIANPWDSTHTQVIPDNYNIGDGVAGEFLTDLIQEWAD